MDGTDLFRADAWAALLLLSALKAAFVLALAAVLAHLLRRHAAATRHLVWAVAFAAALAMPALLVLVPGWEVPVLPAEAPTLWAATPDPAPVGEVMGIALPEAAAPARLPLSLLLVLVWTAGAVLVGGRWMAGVVGAAVLTARARPLRDADWRETTARAAERLGLRRPVRLRVSPALRSPMTWGVRRPVVLLPVSAAQWTEERREVVLMHELGHIRRRDSLTQWLAQSALVLHWFNPLAWRGYRQLLAEREYACDDLVLSTGLRPSVYAGHLLQLARGLGREPRAAFALLPMARPSQVESRLRAILNDQERRDRLSRGLLTIVGVLVIALLLPVAALDPVARPAAAPPPPPPTAPLPPLPPMAPLPPAPPKASHAPLAPMVAPRPSLDPNPLPSPAPNPDPLAHADVEAKRAVVLGLGPTGSSVRPSPLAEQARVQLREVRRRAREEGRARLDAAFAYEMREAERERARVDVEQVLAALDDVEDWDALDAPAEALAAQLSALAADADAWGSLAWVEHEALPGLNGAEGVAVTVEWKHDAEAPRARVHRRTRVAAGSCDTTGAVPTPVQALH